MKICGFSRSIGTSSRVVAEFLADLASKHAKSVVDLVNSNSSSNPRFYLIAGVC